MRKNWKRFVLPYCIVLVFTCVALGADYQSYENELAKKVGGLDAFIDGILGKSETNGDGIIIDGNVVMGMSPSEVNSALVGDSLSVDPAQVPDDPVRISSRRDHSFGFIGKRLVFLSSGQRLQDNDPTLTRVLQMLGNRVESGYYHMRKKTSDMGGTSDFATEYVFYNYSQVQNVV